MGILVNLIAVCLSVLQPYRFVHDETIRPLDPSDFANLYLSQIPEATVDVIQYCGKNAAVEVGIINADHNTIILFLNPYNGRILKIKEGIEFW